MSRSVALFAIAGLSICCAVLAAAPDATRAVIRFDRAVVMDPVGFEAPMAAATMFVPHGWQTQGGVLWGREYLCTNGYNFDWSATSPDGATRISILPQQKWESNNYGGGASTPGCSSAPYTTNQAYLVGVVQLFRPGAQLLDYRRRPDLEQQNASFNSATPTAMGEMRTWVESGEILFAFNEEGRNMRGSIAATVVFSLMRTNAGTGRGTMDALSATAFPAYAVTAPADQLNLEFFEALRRTIKTNPHWEQRLAQHNTAIARVAIQENAKRAAIIAKSNDEIARIREQAWSSYQESADRRAREFGELIKGVETYSDSNAPGGTVELSHNYDSAWRLNDGSYVLSNDVNFEPWRDLGVEGERLEAAQ